LLMYRNSVNFMKITTEFTNFRCEFCLVSRPNNNTHLKSTMQLGLRWVFCRVFRWVCPKKPARIFGYIPGYL